MDFFARLKDAIVSPGSYRELAGMPFGSSLLYLFLLVLLVTLPVHIYTALQLTSMTDELVTAVRQEVPTFVLADGELKVDGPMPIVMDESVFGPGSQGTASDMIIIIDTEGQMDESDIQGHQQGIFIGKDRMVQKDGIRNETMYFKDLQGLRFTRADLISWIPYLKILGWAYVVLGSLAVFLFKLIQALLLGGLALLMAQGLRYSLKFSQGLNLAIYALTLPIILDGLVQGFWPAFPLFFLIYYTAAAIYLLLGVQACKD